MRRAIILILVFIFFSCESDDNARQNPFLVDIGFQFDMNLNLPQFSSLQFPGNFVILDNIGIRSVVVYTPGNDQYFAYELSDPNHQPNNCSAMSVSGLTASCPCPTDQNEYSIFTGQPTAGGDLPFGLKAYRVERIGNVVRVFN